MISFYSQYKLAPVRKPDGRIHFPDFTGPRLCEIIQDLDGDLLAKIDTIDKAMLNPENPSQEQLETVARVREVRAINNTHANNIASTIHEPLRSSMIIQARRRSSRIRNVVQNEILNLNEARFMFDQELEDLEAEEFPMVRSQSITLKDGCQVYEHIQLDALASLMVVCIENDRGLIALTKTIFPQSVIEQRLRATWGIIIVFIKIFLRNRLPDSFRMVRGVVGQTKLLLTVIPEGLESSALVEEMHSTLAGILDTATSLEAYFKSKEGYTYVESYR